MSAKKKVGIEIILDSDSSDCDDSDLVKDLRAKISNLEEANAILSQERARDKWSYQEKLDKFQKEFKGESVTSGLVL